MVRKKTIRFIIILGLGMFLLTPLPGFAEDNIGDLKEQIKILQQRVDELESQQAPVPPFQHRGWDPFAQMQRMQEEMDALFADAFTAQPFSPHGTFSTDMVFNQDLDIQETDEGYEIHFDMAGLDKEQVDIQINQHSITVSGQYSQEVQEEGSNSMMQSRRFGTFLKTIPLPVDADTNNVQTQQQEDDLVITIPKK